MLLHFAPPRVRLLPNESHAPDTRTSTVPVTCTSLPFGGRVTQEIDAVTFYTPARSPAS